MASKSWLTQRFQRLVGAIMPKVTSALQDKRESHQLDLATAENHLIRKELIDVYKNTLINRIENEVSGYGRRTTRSCHVSNSQEQSLSYPSRLGGDQYILEACADFFNQYFQPHVPVLPDHIVTGPGLTACISALLCAICDPGDVVFIPGSYWSRSIKLN